jgi:hypothetical protein
MITARGMVTVAIAVRQSAVVSLRWSDCFENFAVHVPGERTETRGERFSVRDSGVGALDESVSTLVCTLRRGISSRLANGPVSLGDAAQSPRAAVLAAAMAE